MEKQWKCIWQKFWLQTIQWKKWGILVLVSNSTNSMPPPWNQDSSGTGIRTYASLVPVRRAIDWDTQLFQLPIVLQLPITIAAAHGIKWGRFFAWFVETLVAISRPYIKLRLSFLLSIVSASMGQISHNGYYSEAEMAGITNGVDKSSVNSQSLRWRLLSSRNETKTDPKKLHATPQS